MSDEDDTRIAETMRIISELEPEIAAVARFIPPKTAGILSAARSLKRIADKLDQFYDNGITVSEP